MSLIYHVKKCEDSNIYHGQFFHFINCQLITRSLTSCFLLFLYFVHVIINFVCSIHKSFSNRIEKETLKKKSIKISGLEAYAIAQTCRHKNGRSFVTQTPLTFSNWKLYHFHLLLTPLKSLRKANPKRVVQYMINAS